MQTCDVLVVGGGPAGSTCAWKLHGAGLDVLVLDKATFPRHKVCAGWITPAVLEELHLDPAEYAQQRVLQPLTAFRTGRIGGPLLTTDYGEPVSYGIRRCQFDEYLLERSGARLQLGEPVKKIRRTAGGWVVNDRFRTSLLVAAGGHFCPVARLLEGATREGATPEGGTGESGTGESGTGVSPVGRGIHGQDARATGKRGQDARATGKHGQDARATGSLVAAQEIEFELSARQKAECPVQPQIPEIYFCDDLLGYGWCIRKGDFLNVGLGREDRRQLPRHVANFCDDLKRQGRIPQQLPGKFRGHAYLLYEHSSRRLLHDGVVVVGDSAGLAFLQSGEGILPAVESGLIAADVIVAAGGDYRRDRLEPYRQRLTRRLGRRKRVAASAGVVAPGLRRLIGRKLLGSRWFARHVLLDRWFLHAKQPPLS
jgi:flavin-dependent dehydrogenase